MPDIFWKDPEKSDARRKLRNSTNVDDYLAGKSPLNLDEFDVNKHLMNFTYI